MAVPSVATMLRHIRTSVDDGFNATTVVFAGNLPDSATAYTSGCVHTNTVRTIRRSSDQRIVHRLQSSISLSDTPTHFFLVDPNYIVGVQSPAFSTAFD